MSITTKAGDKGQTSLLTGQRVSKSDIRVEAYGTVDEVNSALGLARALSNKAELKEHILAIQKKIMLVMADLASEQDNAKPYIKKQDINDLDELIHVYENQLSPLNHFITPGDTPSEAVFDLARTITRRAERQVVALAVAQPINPHIQVYLNRLSDLCFLFSRVETEL